MNPLIIPEIVQNQIIIYLFNDLGLEITSTGRAGAIFPMRCDEKRAKYQLALVNKYWFQQVSKMVNIENLVSVHGSVYDSYAHKISNPYNLLSFQSKLKLTYFMANNQMYYEHPDQGPTVHPLYHKINGEHGLSGQRQIFYNQFYTNLYSLKLYCNFDQYMDHSLLYEDLLDIARHAPHIQVFELNCNQDFLMGMDKHVVKAVAKMGVTFFAFNQNSGSLSASQEEKFTYFIKKNKRTLCSLLFDNIDAKILLKILPLFSSGNNGDVGNTRLKKLSVSTQDANLNENVYYSDIMDLIYALELDDISLSFADEQTNRDLWTRNSITNSTFCPIRMVPLTKSSKVQVNMEDVDGPLVYSKSILLVELLNCKPLKPDQFGFALNGLIDHPLEYLIILSAIQTIQDINLLAQFIRSNPPLKYLLLDQENFRGTAPFYQALSENTSLSAFQLRLKDRKECQLFCKSVLSNNTLKYICIKTKAFNEADISGSHFTVYENQLGTVILKNKNYFNYPSLSKTYSDPQPSISTQASKSNRPRNNNRGRGPGIVGTFLVTLLIIPIMVVYGFIKK
ncbi:hypothetical protein CYY_003899 [Polysphondylium violaceum]|uniref:Uncharacterized protein n=1 Tax=Polysphondylium violaceum TaxID=133409 RepID=A0A8J4PW99_9MYCE|nr:hypothetical protein CYY_003899 [Polysphondylium violaceum]